MPVLDDAIPVKRIVLPKSSKPNDKAWVDVTQDANMDLLDGVEDDTSLSKIALTAVILSRVVKDWNFTDKNGEKSAITPENIRKIPLADIAYISEQSGLDEAFEPLSDEKKSGSISTSAQKPTSKKAKQ